MENDTDVVLTAISNNPGLRQSQLAKVVSLPLRRVEDVIFELWAGGKVQIAPDSTLRLTYEGEKVFRYFYP